MDTEQLVIPQTLMEVMRSNQEGYILTFGYTIHLDISAIGNFPAISIVGQRKEDKQPIITNDIALIKEVWNVLRPRQSSLQAFLFYGNPELNVWFLVNPEQLGFDIKTEKSFSFFIKKDFDSILATEGHSIEWAGIVISPDVSKDRWSAYVEEKIALAVEAYT